VGVEPSRFRLRLREPVEDAFSQGVGQPVDGVLIEN
jgi:hypothetical protein